jgi:hypothetical protein
VGWKQERQIGSFAIDIGRKATENRDFNNRRMVGSLLEGV